MGYIDATVVRVKGGMPVNVRYDAYGDVCSVRWFNTDSPVSQNFMLSLSVADWEAIHEAIDLHAKENENAYADYMRLPVGRR